MSVLKIISSWASSNDDPSHQCMKNKHLQQSSCVSSRVIASASCHFLRLYFSTGSYFVRHVSFCQLIKTCIIFAPYWDGSSQMDQSQRLSATKHKMTGQASLLVPKKYFWVTNIIQRDHIPRSQKHLVSIDTWLSDVLQRMSAGYVTGTAVMGISCHWVSLQKSLS